MTAITSFTGVEWSGVEWTGYVTIQTNEVSIYIAPKQDLNLEHHLDSKKTMPT